MEGYKDMIKINKRVVMRIKMTTCPIHLVIVPVIFFFVFIVAGFSSGCFAMEKKGFLLQVIDHSSSEKNRDRFIALDDLKRMTTSSVKARGKEENPEHVWVGVLLSALLEREGIPLHLITNITVSAYDGYMSVLTGDLLTNWETAICAYQIEGKRIFPEKYGYMKLVFPQLMAMYWVSAPNRIIITLDRGKDEVNEYKVYFPGNEKFKALFQEGGTIPRINIKDLLSVFRFPETHFHVLTQDGLYREYSVNNIIKHMVLARSEDHTWRIEGVRVPTGLRTRQVFFISNGYTGVFLKSLSSEEKHLWEERVWRNRMYMQGVQKRMVINLFLKNGDRVVSDDFENYFQEKLPLYDIFEKVLQLHPDLDYISLRW